MKVAVVGSGVSGLGATWLLNEYSDHEVHLYEADSRPGGHANTVRFIPPGKEVKDGTDVDTGFIVLNPSTYPNFLRFLQRFRSIQILPTEMTFSVSRDNGLFEWAGSNLFTVFCQPSRLLDRNMWRLIYDVLRFNACARRLIIGHTMDTQSTVSIGEYMDREGYSDSFRDNYLLPMTAAIWSTPPDKCALDFPAQTLIQFLNNHHLLQLTGKPAWLTIKGGSRVYVESILSSLPHDQLHLSTPVKSISTNPAEHSTVLLTTAGGETETYDFVVVACHSDAALEILNAGEGVTEKEKEILGRFRWNRNEAILHSDIRLMPKRRLAWSCWNYLTKSVLDSQGRRMANVDQVSLTYGMNDLQHISEKKYGPVLVTLNPPFEPQADKIVGRYRYDHPVLDAQAVRSQRELHTIQGQRGIAFAGAYLGYGFHEDGFTSGLRAVVDNIPSVSPPFDIQSPDREPAVVWISTVFDILEISGGRALLGVIAGWWLVLWRRLFSFVFDLGHLDAEVKSKKVD